MAISPSHMFGQILGDLLEDIISPILQRFCDSRSLYLDKKGIRATRTGKKVSWYDKYENKHDLDFVIERGGSDTVIGHPVAFIEVAWRRYTKHSRNKLQEIQSAILPIADNYSWDKPFMGAVLAGVFTEPALKALESQGFKIVHFSYESIVNAFLQYNINIAFDEKTPDSYFDSIVVQIKSLSHDDLNNIKKIIFEYNSVIVSQFLQNLANSIDRYITEIVIIPLYGEKYILKSVAEVISFINSYPPDDFSIPPLISYKIYVTYSNNSKIESEFYSKSEIFSFLNYISS